MSGVPRISPGSLREVGPLAWVLAHGGGRRAGTEPMNLFLTLGRHRPLFTGWLHFAGRMMPGGKLPRRITELVILRVAHLRNCGYEWDHHVWLSRRAGVTPEDLERVQAGPEADGWSTRERAVLTAVDELHDSRDVSDETWAELRAHLDERRCIELVLLVGHYEMLATAIEALRIQRDERRRRG